MTVFLVRAFSILNLLFKMKIKIIKPVLVLLTLTLMGCSNSSDRPLPTVDPNVFTINTDITYQTIRGFGGCNSVFRGSTNFPKEVDMQKAYGTGDDELGFSIFRVSIPTNSDQWADIANVAAMAINRNAIVFASPWDAPEDMRDPTKSDRVILPSKYGDYVDHLNSFNTFMSNNGVDLFAISMQNEPDIGEWTQWTTTEVLDFVKHHANNINNKVITAESFNFNRVYYDILLQDPQAAANIDIVGGHIYGNGLGKVESAEAANKEVWMTEYLLNEFDDNMPSDNWSTISDEAKWTQSLYMLETVHEAMESNWSAYIWWYLKRYYSFIGDGLQGSTDGEILKRGWAFSHFSKYIRPGFVRVDVANENDIDLKVTAYEDNSKIVIVVLNDTSSAVNKVQFKVPAITEAKAYQTSMAKNRENVPLSVNADNVEFGFVPKESITTIIIDK